MSELTLKHIEHLAVTIGPRGTCTAEERQAAEYCSQVLRDLDYEVHMQRFRARRSGWAAYSISCGLILVSLLLTVLFPTAAGRVAGALLATVVSVAVLLELAFFPSPLNWLVPAGTSQNVYARALPRGGVKRSIVVVGHVDTHRTPLAFASPRIFRLFRRLITLGVDAIFALAALLIIGAIDQEWLLADFAFIPGIVVVVVFVITLQPEFSRYVPGANDNASGAAAVLALAARLRAQPLYNTCVWLVNSGAEETTATGPLELLKAHPELKGADWLILDTIAGPGAGPCLITTEQLLRPLRADPGLLALARSVAKARPDLGVYEHHFRGLFSEHSPLAASGCRSLAVINFTPRGELPNWHKQSDTFANIDPQVLERTEEFVWEFLQHLDRQA